jgi:hypothetical protein
MSTFTMQACTIACTACLFCASAGLVACITAAKLKAVNVNLVEQSLPIARAPSPHYRCGTLWLKEGTRRDYT